MVVFVDLEGGGDGEEGRQQQKMRQVGGGFGPREDLHARSAADRFVRPVPVPIRRLNGVDGGGEDDDGGGGGCITETKNENINGFSAALTCYP